MISLNQMISIDDFKKVELTVGEILTVEKVPETDKLLKLSVNCGLKRFSSENLSPEHLALPNVLGEEKKDIRQIISGIAGYFSDIQTLVGRKCVFVTNLEPRTIKSLESQGMILALSTEDGKFSLLEPKDIPVGAKVK